VPSDRTPGTRSGGTRGDHVLLAPPYIAEQEDLAEIVARLSRAIDGAIAAAA